jgi:hypothetical protein
MGGECSSFGEEESVYTILVEAPEGRSNLVDLSLEGRIRLNWISKK